MQLRPLLVRPQQAALLLGSGELVADFIAAGWLLPAFCEHRLVLYAYRHLERCVARLEEGEEPVPVEGRSTQRPARGLVPEAIEQDSIGLSWEDQLRGIISLRPLLVRPPQASGLIGCPALLEEFRKGGWDQARGSSPLTNPTRSVSSGIAWGDWRQVINLVTTPARSR